MRYLASPLPFLILTFSLVSWSQSSSSIAEEPWRWEGFDLPVTLQVGYAVKAVDINRDDRLDIAIVDSKRVLWCENPSWEVHVVYETPEAPFDNVCFSPHDINGDGRIDLALGADWQFNNSQSGGSIGWLEHTTTGPWKYHPIANAPTTHRMQWIQWTKGAPPELVVGPLKGKGSQPPGFEDVGIRLLRLRPSEGTAVAPWNENIITDQLHVMHNFTSADLNGDGKLELLTASYEGVTAWFADADNASFRSIRLGTGQEQAAPAKGASEIAITQQTDGSWLVATIEPWHGDKVVVYTSPKDWKLAKEGPLWDRWVIDDQLAWGHAVAFSDLDLDGQSELVVGVRDDRGSEHRRGVRIYRQIDARSGKWDRSLVEAGAVAVEDLTTADLDGDGRTDIVAVGRATHNAKIYWNRPR